VFRLRSAGGRGTTLGTIILYVNVYSQTSNLSQIHLHRNHLSHSGTDASSFVVSLMGNLTQVQHTHMTGIAVTYCITSTHCSLVRTDPWYIW
jgi:hypothetical protein